MVLTRILATLVHTYTQCHSLTRGWGAARCDGSLFCSSIYLGRSGPGRHMPLPPGRIDETAHKVDALHTALVKLVVSKLYILPRDAS